MELIFPYSVSEAITLHSYADFSTVTSPNPEEGAEPFRLAMQLADARGVSLVMANDPDADRLACAECIDGFPLFYLLIFCIHVFEIFWFCTYICTYLKRVYEKEMMKELREGRFK